MEGYRIPVDLVACDPNHYVRCARMLEAVTALPDTVQEMIDFRQWSIRTADGRAAKEVFRVSVIPTLCVNGRKCFENQLPDVDGLYSALMHAARTEEQRLGILEAWTEDNEEYTPAAPHHGVGMVA